MLTMIPFAFAPREFIHRGCAYANNKGENNAHGTRLRRETRIDAADDPAQTIRGGNIDEDDKGGVMVLEGELTLLMI